VIQTYDRGFRSFVLGGVGCIYSDRRRCDQMVRLPAPFCATKPSELSARTFCTFPREFSSLRRPRLLWGSDARHPERTLAVFTDSRQRVAASSQRGLEAADWWEVSADLDRNATDHGESSRPSRRGSYVSTRVLGEPSSPTLTLVALLLDEVKVLWE